MKDWTKYLQEDPKKQMAAASGMESEKQVNPPEFNLTSESSGSNQPIQRFLNPFANDEKKTSQKNLVPDVSKTPGLSGPASIPYPDSRASSKAKENDKFGGIMNSLNTGFGNLMGGVKSTIGSLKNDTKTSSFSGDVHDYVQAVMFGKDVFKLKAKFKDLTIMSLSAIGGTGCLAGPTLESFINVAPSVAKMTGDEKAMRKAVAKGVSQNFEKWRKNVTVPGLPWYPAFAAYPGPVAPPTPNVPVPLITCISSGMSEITIASKIKDSIYGNLPAHMKTSEISTFVEALANILALKFMTWLSAQQVINVLGKGPVPSYAPPFVPVGPVVAGDNIAVPGHLAV